MTDHYLALISSYLQANPGMGLLLAFLVALAESLPIIGTIIPGSVTMTVIGIFVGRGMLPLSITLFWAFSGALTGDSIGFWAGKTFDRKIRNMWPLKKYPHWLDKGEKFFSSHGGKSILLGRFVGPARSTIPLVAGLLKFNWTRFLFAAVPSAVLWALAYVLPGVLIGAISLDLPKEVTTKFLLGGLIIIVALWLVYWLIQRFFILICSFLNRQVDRIWRWLNKHHSSKFFVRLITNQKKSSDYTQLSLIFLALLSALFFAFIFCNAYWHFGIARLNQPIFHLLQSVRYHAADIWFVTITCLGIKTVIISASFLLAAGLALFRQWRACLHLIAITILAAGAGWFFKHLYFSPRPTGFMIVASNSSFPSGHSILTFCILSFIAFITAQNIMAKYRWIAYLSAATIIACVGLSRLYLGAHWLTDVLASWALGMSILLVVITSYRRNTPEIFKKQWIWFCGISVCLLVPLATNIALSFSESVYRYTPSWPTVTTTQSEWWDSPINFLPLYRENRFGQVMQPFNVQWNGNLLHMRAQLINKGWLGIIPSNIGVTAINWSRSLKPDSAVYLLPLLYRNEASAFLMIKPVPNQKMIIEIRLWQTGVTLSDSKYPLWIGTINYRFLKKELLPLRNYSTITLADNAGINTITQDLKDLPYQLKTIHVPAKTIPNHVGTLQWNGTLLLIRADN